MTSSEIFLGGGGHDTVARRVFKGSVRGKVARRNPSHRLVTVAHKYLFAISDELDVSAKLGSWIDETANMAMSVIFLFVECET